MSDIHVVGCISLLAALKVRVTENHGMPAAALRFRGVALPVTCATALPPA